jgi:outer membrane biosynthesis protein TonB
MRDGAMQVTVLAGEVSILNPGTNPLFTLLHNGVSVPFRDGETPMPRTVPLIEIGPGGDETTAATNDLEEKAEIEKESEAAAAPTVDLDSLNPALVPGASPTATPSGDPRVKTLPDKEVGNGLLRSTLTNDDIRTQLRAQAGSFQKCYVTMVNRMSEAGISAGALPKGEVSVAFKILPSGKVEEPRVKKSPFKDSTFDRCVTEALGRLRFRQFQGAAIPIGDFPITLE